MFLYLFAHTQITQYWIFTAGPINILRKYFYENSTFLVCSCNAVSITKRLDKEKSPFELRKLKCLSYLAPLIPFPPKGVWIFLDSIGEQTCLVYCQIEPLFNERKLILNTDYNLSVGNLIFLPSCKPPPHLFKHVSGFSLNVFTKSLTALFSKLTRQWLMSNSFI